MVLGGWGVAGHKEIVYARRKLQTHPLRVLQAEVHGSQSSHQ